jgi:putative PIN family toxin of toxin-antitoxin system
VKVIVDTNVLLAAFGTRGLCESLVELLIAEHDIVLCQGILDEVEEHLGSKFGVPAGRVHSIISFLRGQALLVEPVVVPSKACRDADDLMVLGAAVAGKAEVIVTGDKDLLSVGTYQGVRVMTPRALFLELK